MMQTGVRLNDETVRRLAEERKRVEGQGTTWKFFGLLVLVTAWLMALKHFGLI
jgi:hypothetical protein